MTDLERNFEGLNRLEQTLNAGLVVVTLVVWAFFLWNLGAPERKMFWFRVVVFLHLVPLPLMLVDSNRRAALQFFRFGLLGGLALIIGLPHYLYEGGERTRPRLLVTLGVIVAFGAMYLWITRS